MTAKKIKRFRINPVELGVFLIVTLIFANSVYQLFFDWKGYQTKEISSAKTDSARSPASITGTQVENIEIGCGHSIRQETLATKVRLNGPLCGIKPGSETTFDKVEILNQSNKTQAVVFSDVTDGTYLTDYIPLVSGENALTIKLTYNAGKQGPKTVQQDLVIVKK